MQLMFEISDKLNLRCFTTSYYLR